MNGTANGVIFGVVLAVAILAGPTDARAGDYSFSVVADGLSAPTGIAVRGNAAVFFTEVPTPGTGGGDNAVKVLILGTGDIHTLSSGEPEPVNLAFDRKANLYWTCRTAGVILKREPAGPITTFLSGLNECTGLAVDRHGCVFFTELPTPGETDPELNENTVSVSDGENTTVVATDEPEPTDVAVAPDGTAYWTCHSAGVILRRSPCGVISLFMDNLNMPVGIALDPRGRKLFFTEVPAPGVAGGDNTVNEVDLESGERQVIHMGDPHPQDVAVAPNGNLYWTCTSAGVIVEARRVKAH